MLSPRPRTERDDAGFTLLELMIAMALLSLIGAMTIAFFVGMNTSTKTTIDTNVATAQARATLQSWTTMLSLADSPSAAGTGAGRFVEVTPTTVVFYSNIDANRALDNSARSAPRKIALSLENGELVERDYSETSGALTATRHLVQGVTRTDGRWIFTPYCLTSSSSTTGVAACGPTTVGSTALSDVVRIDLAYTVTLASGRTRSFTSAAAVTGSSS